MKELVKTGSVRNFYIIVGRNYKLDTIQGDGSGMDNIEKFVKEQKLKTGLYVLLAEEDNTYRVLYSTSIRKENK